MSKRILVVEDQADNRQISMLWESPKVISRGEVLEVRNVDGRLHITYKERDSPRSSLMTPTGRAASSLTPVAPQRIND
jgi:hypothetical protein